MNKYIQLIYTPLGADVTMYREWILLPLLIVVTAAKSPYSYINKCCPENYVVGYRKACIPANSTTTIPSNLKVYNKDIVYVGNFSDIFRIKQYKFADRAFSSAAVDIQPMPDNNRFIIENGGLEWEHPNSYNRWIGIPPSNFCIDYRFIEKKNLTRLGYWITIPGSKDTPKSSMFMTCGAYSFSIYFFFLASFCWMSVMSYDIWWTFRGYAKARPIHRRGERFKFMMYCLYAWGLPLAMTICLGGEKLLYLYMPMLILILCNWIFYILTAFNIWRLSRGTAMLDTAAAGTPQAHRTHRQRFMVYLKLSVVMGLNWLLEIISFLYPGFKMWYLTDSYNILVGLAIFLIFVCKKKILKKLDKRFFRMHEKMHWNPSSKSYTSSISDSNQEAVTLQSKISSQPNGIALHNRSRMD
ncbi:hypothetical protein HF086_015385 [Spodoptera exigua]|uniref:Uncharacterized protein n=1 Tax=Spodoptera exigua TaxID=7107 RepID=A0A922M0B9_SPOEX|nr:hypothetical protein HF086_015385 [Spodoptera exigua]